jgi:tagatose-1,6-bisphosphate aldolase non-catalytic subunit AgaZ/GatZ
MEILKNLVNSSKCTLLCVGPMSKNFVDASIEYSRKINFPLMLIASRRQIDSEAFGGGYVNNWSTESFSDYIKKKNAKNILLCRDHGGPYQGAILDKSKNSKKIEMENAKLSFKSDIDSGFKIIHIDPSLYLGKKTI